MRQRNSEAPLCFEHLEVTPTTTATATATATATTTATTTTATTTTTGRQRVHGQAEREAGRTPGGASQVFLLGFGVPYFNTLFLKGIIMK